MEQILNLWLKSLTLFFQISFSTLMFFSDATEPFHRPLLTSTLGAALHHSDFSPNEILMESTPRRPCATSHQGGHWCTPSPAWHATWGQSHATCYGLCLSPNEFCLHRTEHSSALSRRRRQRRKSVIKWLHRRHLHSDAQIEFDILNPQWAEKK